MDDSNIYGRVIRQKKVLCDEVEPREVRHSYIERFDDGEIS